MKRESMPTQRLEEKRVEERAGEGERGREREEAISWRLLRNDFGLLATVESRFV